MADLSHLYRLIGRLTPARSVPPHPRRILLIQPCCIGDVILATPVLKALRRVYPEAHITWAVGSWSRPAIEHHPLLDAILDTGNTSLPVYSPGTFGKFVRQLRDGHYDLAISLVRSPLISAAVLFSGIPYRAGLDSAGRGFGYNLRTEIDPYQPRHEAEIYLDVVRKLGLNTADCYTNIPVLDKNLKRVREILIENGVERDFIVINPAGGNNPGMVMDAKRYPAQNFGWLADQLSKHLDSQTIIIAGPKDGVIVDAVQSAMQSEMISLAGKLNFGEIAALASLAKVYIGNDTGLTHLAAAVGAKT
ncbi:MAG TPA: glycosyltransferase family 9 protein, partial [Phototrophicaceae bacterium]|nr:glycosyltransferase family 9 protein [Phototrophicaceae bacterium]